MKFQMYILIDLNLSILTPIFMCLMINRRCLYELENRSRRLVNMCDLFPFPIYRTSAAINYYTYPPSISQQHKPPLCIAHIGTLHHLKVLCCFNYIHIHAKHI